MVCCPGSLLGYSRIALGVRALAGRVKRAPQNRGLANPLTDTPRGQ